MKKHIGTLVFGTLATCALVWTSFQGLPAHTLPPQGWGTINTDITQANISQTICNPNWSTKSIRPPVSYTNNIKKEYLNDPKWGYTDKNMADYELDHVISLELGGNPTDPKNLYPEPYLNQYKGINYGARQKDKVEGYLNREVCAGRMTLAEAQKEISTNWVSVYEKIANITVPVSGTDD